MGSIRNIYVLCPDRDKPTGGVKTLYRHAQILQGAGYAASVVHRERGFASTWFESPAPVQYLDDLRPTAEDVLVLPEIYVGAFAAQPSGVKQTVRELRNRVLGQRWVSMKKMHDLIQRVGRVVILNLGPYHTFRGATLDGLPDPVAYLHPRVVATITISRDGERYLRFAFPSLRVEHFTKAVDPERFRPADQKKPTVAFMPRRKTDEVVQVLSMLRARDSLGGFELLPIDGMSESQVAAALAEASVFLSFSHAEGLPRPPMEALLSGCVLIGYHGQGGKEYFDPDVCYPIDEGDIVGFAQTVESVLDQLRADPHALDDRRRRGRALIAERYAPETEVAEVVSIWRRLEDTPLPRS